MERNTSGLALSQPAIEAPLANPRRSLLASLRPGPRATLTEVLHRHDDSARIGVEYAMETADISRRTRQDPSTVRSHVRDFIRNGVLLDLGVGSGRSRRIGLPSEFCFPLGLAYKTRSQKYDIPLPVGAMPDRDAHCPHPGISPAHRHADAADTLSVRAHLVGKTGAGPSLEAVPTPLAAASLSVKGGSASLPHGTPGNSMKPPPSIEEPRATTVKRTATISEVDEDDTLRLLEQLADHCHAVGVKTPADSWGRIQLLQTVFHPDDIQDAWESDFVRCLPSHMWERGVNLAADNIRTSLDRYVPM